MNDSEIRSALRDHLRASHADQELTILDELEICDGEARADLVTINGVLAGYEIKGEGDTLVRLDTQIDRYSKVFQRASLVMAPRHRDRALRVLPDWWGAVIAAPYQNTIALSEIRPESENPSLEPLSMALLLWRSEALSLLDSLGLAKGVRSKPTICMIARLCDNVEPLQLAGYIRAKLESAGRLES